ncbi:DUF3592 domain-containing protein [Rhodothermus bifroesti]|uniref:DUF3592 domain-containing protein n=2 Tax=Rhodothermus TaxID=29548 RepID=A0A7V2AYK7_RHOMR|nr:DUF3592 domain-containing protein [Rhodothermus bifroesti]GBD02386.1 hypothetical protein HRbin18_02127 [bacterium HR18]
MVRWIARALWLAPALLFALAVYQAWVAYALHRTWTEGIPAVAAITALEISQRMDVTYDYVNLRVHLPDGRLLEREKLSLPHTLAPLLRGRDSVQVRVRPESPEDLVIVDLARAQWRMAAIQAIMSLLGGAVFAFGVGWWNRLLRRQGDPALRAPES